METLAMVDGFMAEVRKGRAKDRHHHRLDQRILESRTPWRRPA